MKNQADVDLCFINCFLFLTANSIWFEVHFCGFKLLWNLLHVAWPSLLKGCNHTQMKCAGSQIIIGKNKGLEDCYDVLLQYLNVNFKQKRYVVYFKNWMNICKANSFVINVLLLLMDWFIHWVNGNSYIITATPTWAAPVNWDFDLRGATDRLTLYIDTDLKCIYIIEYI